MTLKVLYVDDEPDLREIAGIALELDPGIELRTCGSGQEALEILRGWTPDLVLLDVMMPEMDGPGVHAAIRDTVPNAPEIVYITARAQDAERARLLALGARGVIAKPFDPMELAAEVRALAGR